MAKRKMMIPEYGTVMLNGIEYYRTRIEDADGKLVALYARYYLGMTVNEIAEVEGVDPSRVRDSIRRGLKQLVKYF